MECAACSKIVLNYYFFWNINVSNFQFDMNGILKIQMQAQNCFLKYIYKIKSLQGYFLKHIVNLRNINYKKIPIDKNSDRIWFFYTI